MLSQISRVLGKFLKSLTVMPPYTFSESHSQQREEEPDSYTINMPTLSNQYLKETRQLKSNKLE